MITKPIDHNLCVQKYAKGTDNMVFYSALDVSDGEQVQSTFMIKVRNAEVMQGFVAAWDAARALNEKAFANSSAAGAGAAVAAPTKLSVPRGASVLITSDLTAIYGAGDIASAQRVDKVEAAFTAKYGSAPEFFVRAPGRANIIGEHVDYHDYGVLPFAIQNDILLAVQWVPGATDVQASSLNDSFPDVSFPADLSAEVPAVANAAAWGSYLQCGFKAAFAQKQGSKPSGGMRILVESNLPVAAGVSSSSALVVAGALAANFAFKQDAPHTLDMARAARDAEKAVGTLSGGMDQAACLLGQAGNAQFITFKPSLAGAPVPLPLDAAFVIADCGVPAPKAADGALKYNKRVVEGALGVKLVAKKEGRANWASLNTMQELAAAKGLGSAHPSEVEVFLNSLPEGELTAAQLEGEEHFGCPLASLFEGATASVAAVLQADPNAKFSCKARLLHVLQEAGRVLDAKAALMNGEEGTLQSVGELMNASHSSLAAQYDCSCPELDALVEVARAAGAKGARLVGAGWGGCIIALVQAGSVQAVVDAIKTDYYAAKGRADLVESGVFVVSPSAGAAVYTNSEECEM